MIKEAYCSKEVSILLKEKGFNEKCRGGYHYEFDDNDNPIVMLEEWMVQPYNNDVVDEGFLCSAPTHQMAMAWLREEKNIIVNVWYNGVDYNAEYYNDEDENFYLITDCLCDSYEETVETALKYALENLI